MDNEIILVKLGGSVITDKTKPYTARIDTIRQLAKELKKSPKRLLVAHGSGSFGHIAAQKFGGMRGYGSVLGIATVIKEAMALNSIVRDIFLEEGVPAVSFSPMSMCVAQEGKLLDVFFVSVETALNQGLLPLLYGDVIWDTKWQSTIFSGEVILGHVAKYLSLHGYVTRKIIEVGNTNGIYNYAKKTIPTITTTNAKKVFSYLSASSGVDVTGGMKHKLDTALALTKDRITTLLINGTIPQELEKALRGSTIQGTCIL